MNALLFHWKLPESLLKITAAAVRYKWLLIFTGVCLALTPWMFYAADKERGYDSTGGEILFPFIPLVIWTLYKSAKGLIEVKNETIFNNKLQLDFFCYDLIDQAKKFYDAQPHNGYTTHEHVRAWMIKSLTPALNTAFTDHFDKEK